MDTVIQLSVIIPAFNEQDNILPLVQEIVTSLEPLQKTFEIILVDDCSEDDTWQRIQEVKTRFESVHGIQLPAHGGQSAALLEGLRQARGKILITMDGDLQNDPVDIPKLIEKMDHCDVVCGYRANRRDSWSRRMGSRLAYRVRNLVTNDGIIDTGCTLKAFGKECVADLPPLRGVHRFMPAYFQLHGRKIEQIAVNHRARKHGATKYTNLKRLPVTLTDLLGFWWYRRRLISRSSQ